ncbi:MAG: hypothetical protein ACO3NL_13035, partial [Phycisphaerales bacterium]
PPDAIDASVPGRAETKSSRTADRRIPPPLPVDLDLPPLPTFEDLAGPQSSSLTPPARDPSG